MNLFDFLGPPPPPPWEAQPDSFGYFHGDQPVPCTRAQLEEICAVRAIPGRVWVPGSGGPVPPEEVPFLMAVLRRRLMGRPLQVAGIVAGVGGLLVAQEAMRGGLSLGSPAALYLAMVVALLGMAGQAVWHAARLTPAGFHRMVVQASQSARVARRPVVYTRILAGMMILGGIAQLASLALSDGLAGVMSFVASTPDFGATAAAMIPDALRDGEWYRLVTAAFVHGGPVHFGVNFMALLMLGRDTENYAPRGWLPPVFLLSVLGGSGLSLLLPPDAGSVGNSGGLVGVIAFLGVLAWRRPGDVPPGLLRGILVNLGMLGMIGLVGYAVIDNAGHAGGAIAGGLIGLILIPSDEKRAAWVPGRMLARMGDAVIGILAIFALLTAWLLLA